MSDLDYLKNEPYSFGECKEQILFVTAASPAWKVREQRAKIIIRTEGDEIKIHIPKILGYCKTNKSVECSVAINLTGNIEAPDEMLEFAGTMMVYDERLQTSIVVPAMVMLGKSEGLTLLGFVLLKG